MRFPYVGGRALLAPRCYNTVEIGPPIAPRDIPYWKVTLNPPKGDGKAATVTETVSLLSQAVTGIPASRTTRTALSSMKSGWIISPPPGRHLPAALNILNKALAGRRAPVSRHELSLADTSRAATADWSCRLVELALPAICDIVL